MCSSCGSFVSYKWWTLARADLAELACVLFGLRRSLISDIISWPLALCSCLPSSISWLHSSLLFQLHPWLLWTTCVFLAVSVKGHVLPLIRTVFRKQDMRGSSSCTPPIPPHQSAKRRLKPRRCKPINSVTSLQFTSDVVSQGWAPEWAKKQRGCMFYCYIFWKMEEVSRKENLCKY